MSTECRETVCFIDYMLLFDNMIVTTYKMYCCFSFWFVMKHPKINEPESLVSLQIIGGQLQYNLNELQQENNGDHLLNTTSDTVWQKIKFIPKLMPYMLPIGFVYFFEYFINQALVSIKKNCYLSCRFKIRSTTC